MVSLLTWCTSDAVAPPRPARRAAPVAPMILRNWRLLGFPMVIPLLRPIREFFGHHHTRTDGGPGSQANDSGGQRIRAFTLVLQVDRCIAVKWSRLMDLDLVGNG